jgi:hypothetical protein
MSSQRNSSGISALSIKYSPRRIEAVLMKMIHVIFIECMRLCLSYMEGEAAKECMRLKMSNLK